MGFDVLVPMHLGQLHAYETALLALLAFGPFVVLAVVVVVMRRRDAEEDQEASTPWDAKSHAAGDAADRQETEKR